MRLFPRNAPASQVPEKAIAPPEVLRRYEITVEREFVSQRSPPPANITAHCPDCGHEITLSWPVQPANEPTNHALPQPLEER